MKRSLLILAVGLVALGVASLAGAEEGMWMPSQIPALGPELKAMGMELDPEKLSDLLGDPMGAVVSLGGCTASFVSPDGLVITNHHCVYGSLQFNSTPESDLIVNGFLAKTREEEVPAAPGSYVYVTTAIRDVTKQVLGSPTVKMTDPVFAKAVERRIRTLVDACEKPGGRRCRVANFYEGSSFLEITQMEIRDVRLVYASGSGIGNFGGETDNWMWPRHTGDFGFLRAYVGPDGKPADFAKENVPYHPEHWLKISTDFVKEGDLVWIPGYPGRTFRYRTTDEVQWAHDVAMPTMVTWSKEMIALLEKENSRGKAVELANYGRIRGMANGMKKYEGQLVAMQDGKVEAERQARETKLAELLAGDPKLAADYGDPVAEIAKLNAERKKLDRRDLVLDWMGRSSPMLGQAITLWRAAEERPKPDLDREEGYRDRDRSRFLQGIVRAQRSIEPGSDRATLAYMFHEAAKLPAEQRIAPFDAALAATGKATDDEKIEALLDQLFAGTKVAEVDARKAMASESMEQLAKRGDSMLDFARALAPVYAERREAEKSYDGAMLRVRPKYMKALEKLAGGRLYPDANSTLRFTFGKVQGFVPRDAVVYEPFTTLPGVVAKATGEGEFAAPQALLDAAKSVPPAYVDPKLGAVPVDFLSVTDITGGNSGSATLNGKGELVGLAFDGNWEGVVSDYLFYEPTVRTIHVGATYVRFVMDAVDKAHNLLKEMGLPVYTAE